MRRGAVLLASAALVALMAAVFLLPYLWVASSSLKSQFHIFRDVAPLSWRTFVPFGATTDNYAALFGKRDIGRALANSALVAGGQVACTLILCSMAAYALTRIRFPGSRVVFVVILTTFLLPIEALVVPLYRVVSGLGLQDTLVGAFIPWVASPFGLFLLRQAFEELPKELEDAARIDGAGHLRIFVSIVLPMVRTQLATLALITFLFSWNAFLWPLVIIQSTENRLIQVAVAQSVAPGELPNWGETFAGATIATIPLVLLFLLLQRFFVRGIAMSGLKG